MSCKDEVSITVKVNVAVFRYKPLVVITIG